jgi:hypothetical protein
VGNYEKQIQTEGGPWRYAAKALVKDVTAWLDVNRAALPGQ